MRVKASQALRQGEVSPAFEHSILIAAMEGSLDGILIVAAQGQVVSFNDKFLEMWGFPRALADAPTVGVLHDAALRKLKDPDAFVARVKHLYDHPHESGHDLIELKDGRIFDRHSRGLFAADRAHIGRIWFFRDVTQAKAAERAMLDDLRRTQAQLEIIGYVGQSGALMSGDVEATAREVTELASEVTGCERISVWLFDEEETELRCIDLFEATPARHSAGTTFGEAEFGNEIAAIKASKYINADEPLTDPRTKGYAEAYLEPLRITSMLDVAIKFSGQNLGLLSFEHVDRPHHWTQDEIIFACQLADRIGISIISLSRRKAEATTRTVERLASIGGWEWDLVADRVVWSDELPRIFGRDPQVFPASRANFLSIVHPDDVQRVRDAVAATLKRDDAYDLELRIVRPDQSERIIRTQGEITRDAAGKAVLLTGTIQDITERKASEDKISRLARTDTLTGLANRATFFDYLRQAFAASRRGACAFALMSIDIDRFKEVNDTLGHPVGDQLLTIVAERLAASVRESDVVARLGGDEFVILQFGLTDTSDAGALATKIRNALAMPACLSGNELNITASIGIATYGADVAAPEDMLSQADVALYRAKEEGRDQYRFHTQELDLVVREQVAMTAELGMAISRGEFELHYQPQVELSTGRIVAMEALIRWKHPTRGLLAPSQFLAIAEKSGVITAIGHWVVDEACRQMSIWREAGIAPATIAVNISYAQIKVGSEFVQTVADSLERWGIAPGDLELDVTELMLARITMAQSDVLVRLHKLGVKIAIDDFGTKCSTLDYLKAYRVNRLKIPQPLLHAAARDAESAAMMRAILGMARELDVEVVAQGVETEAQRAFLTTKSPEINAQGFYYSEPVAAGHAADLLRRGRIEPLADGLDVKPAEDLVSA